jgi:hypothetical protein
MHPPQDTKSGIFKKYNVWIGDAKLDSMLMDVDPSSETEKYQYDQRQFNTVTSVNFPLFRKTGYRSLAEKREYIRANISGNSIVANYYNSFEYYTYGQGEYLALDPVEAQMKIGGLHTPHLGISAQNSIDFHWSHGEHGAYTARILGQNTRRPRPDFLVESLDHKFEHDLRAIVEVKTDNNFSWIESQEQVFRYMVYASNHMLKMNRKNNLAERPIIMFGLLAWEFRWSLFRMVNTPEQMAHYFCPNDEIKDIRRCLYRHEVDYGKGVRESNADNAHDLNMHVKSLIFLKDVSKTLRSNYKNYYSEKFLNKKQVRNL